jgi:hypothetical protein
VRKRDEDEFERAFRSAYRSVLQIVSLVLQDRGRAEEVTQDAFVRLYERWGGAVAYEHPEAWVHKVAVRDAIRRANRERLVPVVALVDLVAVEGGVTATVKALTKQDNVQPSQPRPVSIDGHTGQMVRFQVPSGFNIEECWGGESLRPIGVGGSWSSVFPGWTYRLWVLDLNGEPATILAAHGPETTPTELTELTNMVEGLHFTQPR